MSERIKSLEARIDKLLRYIELLDQNLQELKDQVETRANIVQAETIIKRLCKTIKQGTKNDNRNHNNK